jgi:hypothetical protein
MLDGQGREDLKDIMVQCCASTKTCARVLFPDRFFRPFSPIADAIYKVLDDDSINLAVIIAPRGVGKTSTVNMAYPAKKIVFQEKNFIVPISNTATQAVMQGENLKRELLNNRMINKLFGPIKSENDSFSKEMWVTQSGTAVMPRGAGQQVRGILYGNFRPDLIVVDDLEDSEGVNSEEQRKKLKEWFFADVVNSVDRGKPGWKIIVIGTLLHEDSLLANLMEDPDWLHIHLALCSEGADGQLRSNWPEFMTDEAVHKLYMSYKNKGLLDVFAREYMGQAQDKKTAKFQQEHFKAYSETSEDFLKVRPKLENIVICDPAKTVNKDSADTAIVGIGLEPKAPAIYIRDVVAGRMMPNELYDELFAMAMRLNAKAIGIKMTSLNEFIMYPIRTEMIKRKMMFDLIELPERSDKDARINCMSPFYRMGYIYHNEACCEQLEMQLLSHPKSKRKDIMDAEASFIEMFDIGERFFVPKEGDDDDPEEEYKDLYDDYDETDKPVKRAILA